MMRSREHQALTQAIAEMEVEGDAHDFVYVTEKFEYEDLWQ
jgi:hypothetical protein